MVNNLKWNLAGRVIAFVLASASIWCLLAEFYGLCSMRAFTIWIFGPATVALAILALCDRLFGTRELWRHVLIGGVAGFLAAIAYDVFRLPFVFAKTLGIESWVPSLPLFKVFPRFGAMILGEPVEQAGYSLAAHLIGWTYHFSNGITFGVMYLALIGHGASRHWAWAVLFAVGLEVAMLMTPYTGYFKINPTMTFIAVTVTAHLVFGVTMGLLVRHWDSISRSLGVFRGIPQAH